MITFKSFTKARSGNPFVYYFQYDPSCVVTDDNDPIKYYLFYKSGVSLQDSRVVSDLPQEEQTRSKLCRRFAGILH